MGRWQGGGRLSYPRFRSWTVLFAVITDLKVVATTASCTRGVNGIPSKVSDVFLTS